MKKIFSLACLLGFMSCSKTGETVTPTTPVFEDLSPAAYMAKYKSLTNSPQMVDVRTLSEFNEGHRKEAILIDVTQADFDQQAEKQLNKAKPVFVYCRSGSRSKAAAQRLQNLKFSIIYNLNGGFVDIQNL